MPFAMQAATMSAAVLCSHCKSPVPDGLFSAFCCTGCEAVHRILVGEGLTRYYDLGGSDVAPVGAVPAKRTHAWLEPLLASAEAQGGVCALELDVQGIHCAACVWLINEVSRREQGLVNVTVNPALGKVRLVWRNGQLALSELLTRIEAFGYQFGPSRKKSLPGSNDLPLRLGICAAIAMNVMIFSVSFYLGLAPEDGQLFFIFTKLSLVLSTLVVLIGGWPFFRAAWRGVRSGLLHLDLPIALGILLVYGVSLVQARSGRGDHAYLDTLNTFITLMLLGRWLQERVLDRNRRFLLEDDGADGIIVRRVEGSRLATVRAPQLKEGDTLLIAPGELVPVDSELLAATATVTLDWITGESAPRELRRGDKVDAGAFNASRTTVEVKAKTDFSQSPLTSLLRQMPPRDNAQRGWSNFWNRLSARWVLSVLVASTLGFVLWMPKGADAAISVAVALLVVTCPCAIGIALPLAYDLTQANLRRRGFFVRSSDLLDRLVRVRKVIFDKTGTLTLGRLEVRGDLTALDDDARDAAFNLAIRSSHPKSQAIARAMDVRGAAFDSALSITEEPGRGVSCRIGASVWRLGRPEWAVTGAAPSAGTTLSRNGDRVFTFMLEDALRPDAKRELRALADAGFAQYVLSGDSPERVKEVAAALGISESAALASQSPEQKAARVAELDARDTLYLGDGVNDSLAFEKALCAGTPAIDRPVMPGKSDFFLTGDGLNSLREGLLGAQKLRQLVRRVLGISITYNVVAVSLCLAGLMTPLRAAILMPATSLSILLFVAASLKSKPGLIPDAAPKLQEARA